jgi:hypothetical protein
MLTHLVALLVVALFTRRTLYLRSACYAAHSPPRECLLRGALSAHHLGARASRELAAVMYQEAS